MNWLDFLVVAIVVINMFYGWQKGLFSQAFDLAGWLFGIIIALKYSDFVVGYLDNVVKIDLLTNLPKPVMLVVIFIVVRILFLFVGRFLQVVVHASGLGVFNTAGGAAFGFVKGSMQILALFILMSFIRPQFFETALNTSVYSYRIDAYAGTIVDYADANQGKIDDLKGIVIPEGQKKE